MYFNVPKSLDPNVDSGNGPKSCVAHVDFVLLNISKNVNYFEFFYSQHSLSKQNFFINRKIFLD
jgi:hypothetical protein